MFAIAFDLVVRDTEIHHRKGVSESKNSRHVNGGRGRPVTLQKISVAVSPRAVATVLLNQPDRGNAFDQRMLDELAEQFARLAADERVRIVVLRGGGRHFCTGADLAARTTDAEATAGKASK